jgi:hypothetical protein
MRPLLFGALLGLLIAFPQLAAATLAVTTILAAHPAPTACGLALLAGVRPRARGWSR